VLGAVKGTAMASQGFVQPPWVEHWDSGQGISLFDQVREEYAQKIKDFLVTAKKDGNIKGMESDQKFRMREMDTSDLETKKLYRFKKDEDNLYSEHDKCQATF
jgi:hypothetical protein